MKSPYSTDSKRWMDNSASSTALEPQISLSQSSRSPRSRNTSPESPKNSLRSALQGLCVILGSSWLCAYLIFRAYYINFTGWMAPFALLLFVAELHSITHLAGMFYSLWPRKYESWPHPNCSQLLRCNLFICVCGEPPEVIRETILAAKEAARVYNETAHPIHPARVIVLNDGKVAAKDNWREVEAIARELGVGHIARTVPGGYKAGNINNALKETATDDPFNTLDIIFDSDFCALPHFLTEITKPFVDETIDWVQTPQRYQNEKTWVAKASAAHQIFFFEHICPAKGYDNALFLCGTNFAVRRSALDIVGGINTHYITEDYATSLDMHIAGLRGVFIPEVLALGMAPTSLKQYFTQQRRWSKGSFDTSKAYLREMLFGKMTWKQKFHYLLSATYYLIGLRDLILMMAPVPYLFFGVSLIRSNSLAFLLFVYLPLIIPNFLLYVRLFRYPIKSLVLDVVSFPVFTSAFFQSLFGQKLGFVVTIKKYEKENPFAVYKTQMMVAVTLIIGLIYSVLNVPYRGLGMGINYWWASFDATFLIIGFCLIARENMSWGTWGIRDGKKEAATTELALDKPIPAPVASAPPKLRLVPKLTALAQQFEAESASVAVAEAPNETHAEAAQSSAAQSSAAQSSAAQSSEDEPGFAERFHRARQHRDSVFSEYKLPR